MAYPMSSDVAGGERTEAAHYNNLRKDAIYLGLTNAQAVTLQTLLSEYISNVKLQYLATNRIRCPYDSLNPARIMVNGYMLYQAATIDSALSLFSGGAATWYIFAQQNVGSTSFTLAVSTSSTPAANQRLIGECLWTGTQIVPTSVRSYTQPQQSDPDYDSGWFAVVYNTAYTKTHNFGTFPRNYMLFHNTAADGSAQNNLVTVVGPTTAPKSPIGTTAYVFQILTGNDAANGTLLSTHGNSAAGYYRILAWR